MSIAEEIAAAAVEDIEYRRQHARPDERARLERIAEEIRRQALGGEVLRQLLDGVAEGRPVDELKQLLRKES